MKPDIHYPVIKAPGDNIELRYSLRSLANVEHGNVYIVGYKPDWIKNVIHIPFTDRRPSGSNGFKNITAKEKLTCQASDAEYIVLMNDDIYINKKTEIGHYINGHIDDAISWAVKRKRAGYIIQALQNLKSLFHDGLSAYVHVPHKVNRLKNLWVHKKYSTRKDYFFTKDLYVNEYRSDYRWEKIDDLKIYNDPSRIKPTDRLFFSTGNVAARHPDFITRMNALFPNKSKYEK